MPAAASTGPKLRLGLGVVNVVEPLARIRECPLGRPDRTSLQPLHRRSDGAVAAAERQLAATTLEELIDPVPEPPAS